MSLRYFHLVFIVCALALSGFLVFWSAEHYLRDGARGHLLLALGAFLGTVGGARYLFWFWASRKAA